MLGSSMSCWSNFDLWPPKLTAWLSWLILWKPSDGVVYLTVSWCSSVLFNTSLPSIHSQKPMHLQPHSDNHMLQMKTSRGGTSLLQAGDPQGLFAYLFAKYVFYICVVSCFKRFQSSIPLEIHRKKIIKMCWIIQ